MKKKEKKITGKDKHEQQNDTDVQELKSDKKDFNQSGSVSAEQAGLHDTDKAEAASKTSTEQPSDHEAGEAENDAYEKKTEALQIKLDEANDKFLRLFSEFDNYRKRVAKERIELTKTASESIISSLLPILDDLERAAEMSADESATGADQQGIKLIYNKFKSILRQKGVEEITAVGEAFNTDYHDAITHVPAQDKAQKGKIIEELQKGYILNGKVIRYARVIVAN